MSNAPIPWLSSLPVEILHRIFDSIDTPTIILSLRITCRRFKAIVDGYDRYALDFRSISKSNFQLLCRLIDPGKVISLTLSPMVETLDQIELFTSYFRARQFNRLRSLTLIDIKENLVKAILKRFRYPTLTSFSFTLGQDDGRRKNTTATLLSSIIAQANLHHLDLDISSYRVEKITWPVQCTIRYLKISSCVEIDQIFTILRCSPHLQTLVMKFSDYIGSIVSQNSLPTSSQQLTSLTLENLHMNIDNLELLLSLVPSLTHLKLIGFGYPMDGNRWEQFIQINLPFLSQFELFIQRRIYLDTTPVDVKSIIASFQTPFWLEYKKWFFTCEYVDIWPRSVRLYSIPVCVTSLTYEPESKKTSMSTFNPIINNNVSIMDNVNTIKLISSDFSLNDVEQQRQTPGNPMFRKVTNLELEYNVHRLQNWTSFISTLVDITTVTQIKLTGMAICLAGRNAITDLSNLLQQACSLTSLDICCQYESRKTNLTAQDICSMTPSHVKHLATSIKNLDEAKISLEQLQHLSTARFFYDCRDSSSNSFIEWLEQKKTGSSHFVGAVQTKIWLGHNNIQPKVVEVKNKRIKLTDEHHNS